MKKRKKEKPREMEKKVFAWVLAAGVFFIILAWLFGGGSEISDERGFRGEESWGVNVSGEEDSGLYNAGGGLNQRLRQEGIEIELELPESESLELE